MSQAQCWPVKGRHCSATQHGVCLPSISVQQFYIVGCLVDALCGTDVQWVRDSYKSGSIQPRKRFQVGKAFSGITAIINGFGPGLEDFISRMVEEGGSIIHDIRDLTTNTLITPDESCSEQLVENHLKVIAILAENKPLNGTFLTDLTYLDSSWLGAVFYETAEYVNWLERLNVREGFSFKPLAINFGVALDSWAAAWPLWATGPLAFAGELLRNSLQWKEGGEKKDSMVRSFALGVPAGVLGTRHEGTCARVRQGRIVETEVLSEVEAVVGRYSENAARGLACGRTRIDLGDSLQTPMAQTATLSGLAAEMLGEIISYLSSSDLCILALTARHLDNAVCPVLYRDVDLSTIWELKSFTTALNTSEKATLLGSDGGAAQKILFIVPLRRVSRMLGKMTRLVRLVLLIEPSESLYNMFCYVKSRLTELQFTATVTGNRKIKDSLSGATWAAALRFIGKHSDLTSLRLFEDRPMDPESRQPAVIDVATVAKHPHLDLLQLQTFAGSSILILLLETKALSTVITGKEIVAVIVPAAALIPDIRELTFWLRRETRAHLESLGIRYSDEEDVDRMLPWSEYSVGITQRWISIQGRLFIPKLRWARTRSRECSILQETRKPSGRCVTIKLGMNGVVTTRSIAYISCIMYNFLINFFKESGEGLGGTTTPPKPNGGQKRNTPSSDKEDHPKPKRVKPSLGRKNRAAASDSFGEEEVDPIISALACGQSAREAQGLEFDIFTSSGSHAPAAQTTVSNVLDLHTLHLIVGTTKAAVTLAMKTKSIEAISKKRLAKLVVCQREFNDDPLSIGAICALKDTLSAANRLTSKLETFQWVDRHLNPCLESAAK
ncbi:hypothetical protein B0H16DRAFT_1477670 [Mycena metata]|uniref:BRCT domain-containing protein n=1 Tax=Mycena metata TaxID=1033252 RepID=A0AAD7H936_9AGAR|nr:hypothetical protein B0H16DRAFT_1477670 [Mycena metata]